MRAIIAGFGIGLRSVLTDFSSLVMRGGFLLLILVVMSALWHAAIDAHHCSLGGYEISGLLWYVFGAQVAVIAARQRTVEEVGEEIGSGAITVPMLRPVPVVAMWMAMEAGSGFGRIALIFPCGAALTWLLAGPPPNLVCLLLAVPAVIIGGTTNIAFQHAVGGTAFWFKDAKSGWFLYQKLVFLPGGMLIPLELLPTGVASVCQMLPFSAMAYIPGRIASGHLDPGLLLIQAGWLILIVAIALAVFALGQRRLEVVGG
ncbi:MAG: ABC transporter permease [Candidatus Dormibacteraceae bacterium]